MAICTFFGHRDCPQTIEPKLRKVLTDLIIKNSVDYFYVGNQGAFDALVRKILQELAQEYPQLHYAVVLAYVPVKKYGNTSDMLLPDGIESVPPRYAISWRNEWMLHQADFVISYINHEWGGAAKYVQKAVRQKKKVIPLGNI